MRRTKQDTEAIIEHILDVSIKYFSEKGYEGANLNEIAEAAGMTRGPFYYHFKNKLELYEKSIARYLDWKKEKYDNILKGDKYFFDKIREYLLLCSNLRISEYTLFTGIESLPKLAKVKQMREEMVQNVLIVKENNVVKAINDGVLKPDTNVKEFMAYFHIVACGIESLGHSPHYSISKDSIERLVDTIVTGMNVKYKA